MPTDTAQTERELSQAAQVFKPFIVTRGERLGGCQVFFPLTALDTLLAAVIGPVQRERIRLLSRIDELEREVDALRELHGSNGGD